MNDGDDYSDEEKENINQTQSFVEELNGKKDHA